MSSLTNNKKKYNPTFYGIVRISHSNQKDNNSLEKQHRALVSKGVPKEHILELIGSSRCNSNEEVNEKLENFLSFRKAGEVVLFTEPSRFSRCYFWAVPITVWLYNNNVSVWPLTFNRPLLLGNALHTFFSQILAGEEMVNYNQFMVRHGIDLSKRVGQYKGSCSKLSPNSQRALKLDLEKLGSFFKGKDLMAKYEISRTTLYRYKKKLTS